MNIIVIGATQGLGLEIVRKFLFENHTVAAGVVDRKTPPALGMLQNQFGSRLMVFQADVTKEEEIRAGADLCLDFFGQADGLCNTAGILLPGDRTNPIHQCDITELRRTFDVNTIGVVIVAKYFYPVIKKGGKLLSVTSEGVGIKNCGTWIPCYALSKTAATKVSGLFNEAVKDIDFYSVHPGRMDTEMGHTTAQITPQESADGFYRLITGMTPLRREEWYINYKGEPMEA